MMEIDEIKLLERLKDNFVIVINQWWNKKVPLQLYTSNKPFYIGSFHELQLINIKKESMIIGEISVDDFDLLLKNNWLEKKIGSFYFKNTIAALRLNEMAKIYLNTKQSK